MFTVYEITLTSENQPNVDQIGWARDIIRAGALARSSMQDNALYVVREDSTIRDIAMNGETEKHFMSNHNLFIDEIIERFNEIFNLVKNPDNWKEPIDAVVKIHVAELALYKRAIAWYGGGEARAERIDDETFRLIAPGYYQTIGA